jgi:putative transposase
VAHLSASLSVFRGKYLAGLERLRTQQRLTFAGESAAWAADAAWNSLRQHLYAKPWVVYAKPSWGSPEQVLKYLSRYTHRVAIANSRLVFVGDGVVRFRYTDYATGGTAKVMELRAEEFLRRFLLHVVPTGFVRIRHYGVLANRTRQAKLARARQLLAVGAATPLLSPVSVAATDMASSPTAAARCPLCAGTHWRRIARLLPQRGLPP